MAGLHNPAPGKPHYEHNARPGARGTQAGTPRSINLGNHPDNNPGIVKPDYKEASSVKPEMKPIPYGDGPEHGQSRGELGRQHGAEQSHGDVKLSAQDFGPGRKYSQTQNKAGRGNP